MTAQAPHVYNVEVFKPTKSDVYVYTLVRGSGRLRRVEDNPIHKRLWIQHAKHHLMVLVQKRVLRIQSTPLSFLSVRPRCKAWRGASSFSQRCLSTWQPLTASIDSQTHLDLVSRVDVPAAASSLERLSFRELVRCRPVLQSFYGKLLALSVTSG